jgi:ATP-dependent Clp protease adapter protein ClpS
MKLYILNDNKNTFESVIESVQLCLNYPYMQCISIVHIVHNVGECLVKESDDSELISVLYECLVKNGINAKLEN